MSEQGGDTRIELMFRLEAALKRIETLEADVAASEHNFKTMRQLRNEAADRIEQLENALREIAATSYIQDQTLSEIVTAVLAQSSPPKASI